MFCFLVLFFTLSLLLFSSPPLCQTPLARNPRPETAADRERRAVNQHATVFYHRDASLLFNNRVILHAAAHELFKAELPLQNGEEGSEERGEKEREREKKGAKKKKKEQQTRLAGKQSVLGHVLLSA